MPNHRLPTIYAARRQGLQRRLSRPTPLLVLALAAVSLVPLRLGAQHDPVVQRIIELGTRDNRVMEWADMATNRFGGRLTGSDAYTNAVDWAVWQFRQWGLEVELHEVGEVPVGFNRGPWFGRMVQPREEALTFGTPSFTAGTKGVQRGRVTLLRADPFSINGRNPTPQEVEAKRAAVEAAIAEVRSRREDFKDAWVLIGGNNTGFGRDGRRATQEYSDSYLMPPLTRALVEAGALGTIQRATEPIRILDGHVNSWEELPVLPDIKLLDRQYDEIRALVEAGQAVELEFDIRNWFKRGPVKYHNVVATLPGTTYPDEWILLGAHFDSFDGGTGAVDNGSGFSVQMEAIRLIQAAGGKPKRTIALILFAAEENGLVGSLAWVRDHPQLVNRMVAMINRDGSPGAITGATVPEAWSADFEAIVAPLRNLNPRWPFALASNGYPSPKPDRPGGSDHSSFAMAGVPLVSFRNETDYVYNRAWHTLFDTYNELVPYTEHQKHSALVTAVVAFGMANTERTLPREGVYLPDGLFVDVVTESGARFIAEVDYRNNPLAAAYFVRLLEGRAPAPPAGGPPGGGPGRGPAPGRVAEVTSTRATVVLESEAARAMALPDFPIRPHPTLKHDAAGILGISGPDRLYVTLGAEPALDRQGTALGRVVAGTEALSQLRPGEPLRSLRILRSGPNTTQFRTDDETFRRLLEQARR